MKSDRPIFILGCPRSGTTMLQLMTHAHPRIAIPPETRFMVSAYQRRLQFGNLTDPSSRVGTAPDVWRSRIGAELRTAWL